MKGFKIYLAMFVWRHLWEFMNVCDCEVCRVVIEFLFQSKLTNGMAFCCELTYINFEIVQCLQFYIRFYIQGHTGTGPKASFTSSNMTTS